MEPAGAERHGRSPKGERLGNRQSNLSLFLPWAGRCALQQQGMSRLTLNMTAVEAPSCSRAKVALLSEAVPKAPVACQERERAFRDWPRRRPPRWLEQFPFVLP
jgi:hypothetical protein